MRFDDLQHIPRRILCVNMLENMPLIVLRSEPARQLRTPPRTRQPVARRVQHVEHAAPHLPLYIRVEERRARDGQPDT